VTTLGADPPVRRATGVPRTAGRAVIAEPGGGGIGKTRQVELTTLREFLRGCTPLDTLSEDQLQQAAQQATVRDYDTGDLILDAFTSADTGLYVVWTGRVDLWSSADRIQELPDLTVGAEAMFGYVAALVGEAVGPRAVAADPCVVVRLEHELVDPAFATRNGARLLAREITASRRRSGDLPTYTVVDDLIVADPLVVDRETTIGEAASRMEAAGLPYAAVRHPDGGYGVVTDAILRRVVAAAWPVSLPVATVMRVDPPTVALGASAAEGLIAVLEADVDVVLVSDRAGELRGAVVPRDFAVSSTTAAASLHEQIRRAETVTDLEERYRRVPDMLTGLMARGLGAERVITVHSALIDSLVRRAIELVMAGHPDLRPDQFTWLSLGSNGRREALLSSDIDAAVSFADEVTAGEISRYHPAFFEVTRVLERSGINHDRHGVSPVLPKFARTHADWRRASRAWLQAPNEADSVIMICLLVDGRAIHGDRGLPEVARVFRKLRRHRRTMSVLLSASTAPPTRTHWLRKSVDLKRELLLPIANIARWAALTVGSTLLPTTERLLAASGTPMLSQTDGTALADAFRAVQEIRLTHQVHLLREKRRADDVVNLTDLPPVDRAVLSEAARVVAHTQRRMRNVRHLDLPQGEDSLTW
jgi:CBS domain-containing protein